MPNQRAVSDDVPVSEVAMGYLAQDGLVFEHNPPILCSKKTVEANPHKNRADEAEELLDNLNGQRDRCSVRLLDTLQRAESRVGVGLRKRATGVQDPLAVIARYDRWVAEGFDLS